MFEFLSLESRFDDTELNELADDLKIDSHQLSVATKVYVHTQHLSTVWINEKNNTCYLLFTVAGS